MHAEGGRSMVGCHHVGKAVNIAAVDTGQLKLRENRARSPAIHIHSQQHHIPVASESNWNCVRCGTSEFPMLCLSCGLIHCGRYASRDGLRHYDEYPEHSITMDCYNYSVFCYQCDEFVGNDTIDGKIASIRASLRFHNASRNSDHCYSDMRISLVPSYIDSTSQFEEGTEDEDLLQPETDITHPRAVGPEHDEDSGSVPEDVPVPGSALLLGGRILRPRKRKQVFADDEFPTLPRHSKELEILEETRWRGLRNLGNTCFMNAVLQALNSVDVFRLYVCSLPLLEAEECKESRPPEMSNLRYKTRRSTFLIAQTEKADNGVSDRPAVSAILAEELRQVLLQLSNKSCHALSPDALFHTVWQISSRFSGYQQQDSHEFLRVVLDRLHCELRRCRLPADCSSRLAAACGVDFSPTSSAISLIFEGSLQSEVTCLSCEMASNKQDPFLDLSLDIFVPGARAGTVGLLDCIRRFFEKEELDTCEQYMCGRCEARRPSTKQLFLRCLPKVLCLHLKRFRWTHLHRGKLDNMVEFPLKGLDLSPFVCKSKGGGEHGGRPRLFDLSSIVVHHGSGVSSGHYTTYGLRNGSWYHYNDSSVKPCSEHAVLKQKAYLLFYTRRGT